MNLNLNSSALKPSHGAAPLTFGTPCRFEAASTREALRLVREQLGADAMILSSEVTALGVAIVAAVELAPLEVAQPAQWLEQAPPLRDALMRLMLGAGLSPGLARATLRQLPATNAPDSRQWADAVAWLKTHLASELPVLTNEDSLMDAGGVYALVGPTGVGKTTTTAKLAARCVMRFGAERLALVTTDTFRIGAVEQLRLYGEILGVPVYAVRNAEELDGLLTQLHNKHMVLIDTVGMSQRDRGLADQLALLCAPRRPVKRLLLLNAASHGDTLDEVVRAYQRKGTGSPRSALAGCIFTKVDEAVHSGALIDIAIREQLPVHYVANGQQVPEHLLLADAQALVNSALAARAPGPWAERIEWTQQADRLADVSTSDSSSASASACASASRQCAQLLKALAHDTLALTRARTDLQAASVGFDQTLALWQALHSVREGRSFGPDSNAIESIAELHRTELHSAGSLLAVKGRSSDAARPDCTLLLSGRTGMPLLAFSEDAPARVGPLAGELWAVGNRPSTELGERRMQVVQCLPQAPSVQEIHQLAERGEQWVAIGRSSLRVQSAAGDRTTLGRLLKTACFGEDDAVMFRRKPARQALAEVELLGIEGSSSVNAPAPRLRCVIKRLSDDTGKLLMHSYVLCPSTLAVPAAQLVQWPVWRSEAEPCFKLLKKALLQAAVEGLSTSDSSLPWQLAAQMCSTAYRLQRCQAPGADAARQLLAQLAGRVLRPSQPISGPALLLGLGKFMALLNATQ